jgi:hypothetical protein
MSAPSLNQGSCITYTRNISVKGGIFCLVPSNCIHSSLLRVCSEVLQSRKDEFEMIISQPSITTEGQRNQMCTKPSHTSPDLVHEYDPMISSECRGREKEKKEYRCIDTCIKLHVATNMSTI